MTTRLIQIAVFAALLSAGLVGSAVASADPVPRDQCGAHTDALECIIDPSPQTP